MIGLLVAAALSAAHPAVANVEPTDAVAAAIKQQQRQAMPSPYFLDSSTVLQVSCPTKFKDDDGVGTGRRIPRHGILHRRRSSGSRHVTSFVDEDSPDNASLPGLQASAGLPIKVLEVGKGSRSTTQSSHRR
jgi:hypothetical protein